MFQELNKLLQPKMERKKNDESEMRKLRNHKMQVCFGKLILPPQGGAS